MSDLISTPSQTQSTVSDDAFEALIDLLTSDGIDKNLPENHARAQANVSLRDPSGKLDYDKIRLVFASQHAQKPPGEERSDDELHSPKSTPSAVSTGLHSTSPKPVEPTAIGLSRHSAFGNQFRTPIETGAKEDVPPASLFPQLLSFDELNTALSGAQEEVKSLRQQYVELQDLVSKRFGAVIPDQTELRSSAANTDKLNPGNRDGRFETQDMGSGVQPGAVPVSSPPSDLPTEIANFSENESKRVLSVLARSLNLSLDALTAMASLSTPLGSTSPHQSLSLCLDQHHDVISISRALNFLSTVDELIWRRSSTPSGSRALLPVFSEENVVALVARLELWERAVRRSSRH